MVGTKATTSTIPFRCLTTKPIIRSRTQTYPQPSPNGYKNVDKPEKMWKSIFYLRR